MVAALDKDGDEDPRTLRKEFSNNCLADFVRKEHMSLLPKMKMDQKFQTEGLGSWNDQPRLSDGQKVGTRNPSHK